MMLKDTKDKQSISRTDTTNTSMPRSMKEDSREATALSRFVWSQRKAGKEDLKLEWSDDGRAPHYRSGSRVCGLCNLETYNLYDTRLQSAQKT